MSEIANSEHLVLDGSHGEGGGQILRSTVTLAALLGQPIRIENIRAQRRNPGLQAQHLTSVQAAAEVCNAEVTGATLGSTVLSFQPTQPPTSGDYAHDVAQARKGGSAGSTSLVFQTAILPLTFTAGGSRIAIEGGTHVAWSPPYHYLADVFLPAVTRLGIEATINLERWGWYPHGGGLIWGEVRGLREGGWLAGIDLIERGALVQLTGFSAVSNLPDHILERQARRAESLLQREGFDPMIRQVKPEASGPGTAVYLRAEYEHASAAFTGYGRRGKRAEKVAEEAVEAFLAHHTTGAATDPHLADQFILPTAVAKSDSTFTTSEITNHLLTNIWVIEQFTSTHFDVEGDRGETGKVIVHV
ncbi:MAG: RNA 3'-terminal phosphate cyclase [Anaerolineales bacterium]|nr:RNA 3'-terminal phosphate cyclase [Anaerolineales bacterium]